MLEVELKDLEKDYRSDEAYKMLRTNIEFSGEKNKVLVFTSCTPGEGKSTVSLSVAESLAQSGKKVLFVDADLRKSVLAAAWSAWRTERAQPFSVRKRESGGCSVQDTDRKPDDDLCRNCAA